MGGSGPACPRCGERVRFVVIEGEDARAHPCGCRVDPTALEE